MRRALAQQLARRLARAARRSDHAPFAPRRTPASFGPIDRRRPRREHAPALRGDAARRAPSASRPARRSTPRPSGIFRIVNKQRDPWWYPPTYDSWAQGPEAGPARPGQPARHALDGLDRAGRRHPRHARRRLDRLLALARLHPDARPGRRVAVRARRASARPSSFSRQLDAGGRSRRATSDRDPTRARRGRRRSAAGARFAHDVGERPAEQDQRRRRRARRRSRTPAARMIEALPSARGRRRDGATTVRSCLTARASTATRTTPPATTTSSSSSATGSASTPSTSSSASSPRRSSSALVETNELDEEETARPRRARGAGRDRGAASRGSAATSPRNWERVSLVGGESLVYWLRKLDLPRRLARPPGQARRARGRLGRRRGRVRLPASRRRPAAARARPGPVVARAAVRERARGPSGDRPAAPARAARDPRARAYLAGAARASTTTRATRSSSRSASLTWLVLLAGAHARPGAAAGAGARRRRLRDDRRGRPARCSGASTATGCTTCRCSCRPRTGSSS